MIRYEGLRVALRNRRKDLGLTQREVARRTGMTSANFNQLEVGARANPTVDTLADWCRALGGSLTVGVDFDDPADDKEEDPWPSAAPPARNAANRQAWW